MDWSLFYFFLLPALCLLVCVGLTAMVCERWNHFSDWLRAERAERDEREAQLIVRIRELEQSERLTAWQTAQETLL